MTSVFFPFFSYNINSIIILYRLSHYINFYLTNQFVIKSSCKRHYLLVLFSRYIVTHNLYSMEIEQEVKKDEGSSGAIEETEVDEMKKYV